MYDDKTMLEEVKEIFNELTEDKWTFFSFIMFSIIFLGMLFSSSLIQYVFFL